MRYKIVKLSGWGNYPVLETHLYRPERIREVLNLKGETSWLARGLGRSYGDAAVNDRGGTVLMTRLNRFLEFDETSGVLHAEAGVTLEEILRFFVPREWFLPVTPGTKYVTLGGAIASDVHGKNHHHDGSFGNFVESIELITSTDEVLTCSRNENPELFQATLGGNGLTGIILSARIRLMPIESAYIQQTIVRTQHLDETLASFEEHDRQYQYSVAWVDCFAGGAQLGRSAVILGNHAPAQVLPTALRSNPLPVHGSPRIPIPFRAPNWLLSPVLIRTYSQYHYRWKSRRARVLVHYDPFFYPLDGVRDWNRLYGTRGFIQWQCVLPFKNGAEGIRRILEWQHQSGRISYLAVLKKMGKGNGGLSFPMEGYTLALDFPVTGHPEQWTRELNELVVSYGGRVYLTKDALLSREHFEAMYPELQYWKQIKQQVDPGGRFTSAQANRLGLLN